MKTDSYYKNVHIALKIETGEENPEIWSLCFGKPLNNKLRVSSKISRRQRERERKQQRDEKREGTGCNMFLVVSWFCRRYTSLKHTHNGAAGKADFE